LTWGDGVGTYPAHIPSKEKAAMSTVTLSRERVGLPWWLFLVTGIAWLIFAWIVLSFDYRTVWAVAIWTGIALIGMGFSSFVAASVLSGGWKFLGYLAGVAGIVVGILCFAWPGQTFLALAALIGWYLLFKGIFDIVIAFASQDEYNLWWLTLIMGILEILLGFWAIGYDGASIALLVVWVGATALARGITDIFLAFQVKKLTD
jgi:uncharacterized membrane protein HdeD (DUF308 family)